MPFSLRPKIRVDSLYDITPELLAAFGIKLLLLDLDNTLLSFKERQRKNLEIPKRLSAWKRRLNMKGIAVAIASNTRKERAAQFAAKLGVRYINNAKKPSASRVLPFIERLNTRKEETALVGDQIFTDVLCANLAGITSIVIKPLKLHNTLIAARYLFEIPFRLTRKKTQSKTRGENNDKKHSKQAG